MSTNNKKIAEHIEAIDIKKIAEANNFMIIKYNGQERLNGEKYYMHPLRVWILLKDYGYGMDQQLAGLFHDMLKYTDTTLTEIKKHSNDRVAEAIQILLLKKGEFISGNYVDPILKDEIALPVSLADRLDKLHSIESNKLDLVYNKNMILEDTITYFNKAYEASIFAEDYCKVMSRINKKR